MYLINFVLMNSFKEITVMQIWDRDEVNNTWICTASWKTHFGSVWKVTWAHPEFGQVKH